MKLRNLLLAATVLAAPLALASHAAKAQPVTGPYVGLGFGYNIEQTQKAKNIFINRRGGTANGVPNDAHISMHNGFVGEGSLGYGLGNGFRVEVEGDYYENRFDKYKAGRFSTFAQGKEQKYGVFGNALYDFDLGIPWMFPYVGGGIGYQADHINFNGGGINIHKTKDIPAYQGIAGVAFPIPPVPGLSFTVEYRYTGLAGSRKFNGG